MADAATSGLCDFEAECAQLAEVGFVAAGIAVHWWCQGAGDQNLAFAHRPPARQAVVHEPAQTLPGREFGVSGSGGRHGLGPMVKLNDGAMPALRMGDQGIGNLGAPVPITIPTQFTVLI